MIYIYREREKGRDIYIYIHDVHAYVHTYTDVYTYQYIYINIYNPPCIHACIHACMHACMHQGGRAVEDGTSAHTAKF